jgi:hypothetical protein
MKIIEFFNYQFGFTASKGQENTIEPYVFKYVSKGEQAGVEENHTFLDENAKIQLNLWHGINPLFCGC